MPKNRKKEKHNLRPVFHIYCEGTKTEPYYIEHYIKNHCNNFRQIQLLRIKLNEVIKIAKTNKTDPESLVMLAICEKLRTPSEDVFWCVYDREAENSIPEANHRNAYQMAVKN